MITEDELRDRLHAESVQLMPRGDLLKTIAAGHARRHKRARAGLIGGSIAATALVVALLGSLFAGGAPLGIEPASPGDKQVIERAKQASIATRNMIMHFQTDMAKSFDGTAPPSAESWALRSEKLARIRSEGRSEVIRPPDLTEVIDYEARTVTTENWTIQGDVVPYVAGSGITDPDSWFDGIVEVHHEDDGDIRFVRIQQGLRFDFWVDPKTYMLKRAVFGSYTLTIDWLPATAENRELLHHTAPPDFKRQTWEEKMQNQTNRVIPTK